MVRKNAPLSGMAGGNAPIPETWYARTRRTQRHGMHQYAARAETAFKKNTGFGKFRSPFFVAVRQQYAASRSYNVT